MNRKKTLAIVGAVILALSLAPLLFLCANTRIDPQIRASYETSSQPQPENDDMTLLLQMLNGGGGTT